MGAKEVIINHFCSRFIKSTSINKISNISDMLNLPLSSLKNTTDLEVKILKENDIIAIRDLGNIDLEKLDLIKKTTQINTDIFEIHSIISKLIKRSWLKRSEYTRNDITKVCFVGLDYAGKSTLISLFKKEPMSKSINQEPTIDVNHSAFQAENLNIIMWDFAGQSISRKSYFREPEKYFLNIKVLIFVFDIQDQERYDESLNYLDKLLSKIVLLGENPYIVYLIHKFDPELRENPEILIGLDYLKEKIGEKMKNLEKFQYEIITSSIFSTFQKNPEVVSFLKELFKGEKDNPNLLLIDVIVKLTENLFTIGDEILKGQQEILTELKSSQLYQQYSGENSIATVRSEQRILKPSEILQKVKASADEEVSNGDESSLLDELKMMFKVVNSKE